MNSLVFERCHHLALAKCVAHFLSTSLATNWCLECVLSCLPKFYNL